MRVWQEAVGDEKWGGTGMVALNSALSAVKNWQSILNVKIEAKSTKMTKF